MARFSACLSTVVLALLLAAPMQAAAQDIYEPHELSAPPSIKNARQAQQAILRAYPRALRDNSIGGQVHVRFVVTAEGSVDPASVEVVAASVGALGDAAAKAVAKIRFNPGQKDGSPVAAIVVMPITFGTS